MGDNGKIITPGGKPAKVEEPQEKVQTNEEGHLARIKVGDKEFKVINSCTMIEIVVHRLENGKELQQVIAHEFMMTDHKPYMIKLLTDAINTVAKAVKRKSTLSVVSEAMLNKIMNRRPRMKDKFPRRK